MPRMPRVTSICDRRNHIQHESLQAACRVPFTLTTHQIMFSCYLFICFRIFIIKKLLITITNSYVINCRHSNCYKNTYPHRCWWCCCSCWWNNKCFGTKSETYLDTDKLKKLSQWIRNITWRGECVGSSSPDGVKTDPLWFYNIRGESPWSVFLFWKKKVPIFISLWLRPVYSVVI